jgi:hypothetical protein
VSARRRLLGAAGVLALGLLALLALRREPRRRPHVAHGQRREPASVPRPSPSRAEFVIVHGRFSGNGRPRNWIAADVLRVVDGLLVEHWDVLQDEATAAESRSGLPMFGTKFPG